jgi:hypothetical protein
MTTGTSFRLALAALIVLALPGLVPMLSRCVGQESGSHDPATDARLMADRGATLRVLAVETRAWVLVLRDPDEAYSLLKETLDAIRADPNLSDPCRESLQASLEWALGNVISRGLRIKQREVERLEFRSELRARLSAWQFQIKRVWGQLSLLPNSE